MPAAIEIAGDSGQPAPFGVNRWRTVGLWRLSLPMLTGSAVTNRATMSYCEIRDAVDAAQSGDRIRVADGEYKPFTVDKDDLYILPTAGANPTINARDYLHGVQVHANDVRITGLDVHGADISGFFVTGDHNRLIDNTVNHNDMYGFFLAESNDNTLKRNEANFNDNSGFLLFKSHDNILGGDSVADANRAEHNDVDGFALVRSKRNSLTNNESHDNERNGFKVLYGGDVSPCLWYNCDGTNILADNQASDNEVGFLVQHSNGNELTNNSASRNRIGFQLLDSDFSVLEHNTSDRNSTGFELSASQHNELVDNSASVNSVGFRIQSDHNTLIDNRAANNYSYGFQVNGNENVFQENGAYRNFIGFAVAGTGNEFIENYATGNTLGYAILQDLDARDNDFEGNTASNNLADVNRDDIDIF